MEVTIHHMKLEPVPDQAGRWPATGFQHVGAGSQPLPPGSYRAVISCTRNGAPVTVQRIVDHETATQLRDGGTFRIVKALLGDETWTVVAQPELNLPRPFLAA